MARTMTTKGRAAGATRALRNRLGLKRGDYPAGHYGEIAFRQSWPQWAARGDAVINLRGNPVTIDDLIRRLATG